MKPQVKYFFPAIILFIVSVYFGFSLTQNPVKAADIMVYKSPTCGCCNKWVSHLESEGFNVKTKNLNNVNPIKNKLGVKSELRSCHTAVVNGYFIEGHVPASDIKRLLNENPDIKGLAVPGMPMGSPGMEGHRKDKYDVIAIDKNNNSTFYSKH